MSKNLQPVLEELHKAFNHLNGVFYDGKLPEVVIAIRSQGKRQGVLGWFTPTKVWTDGTTDKHEIVITAETLNRDYLDIMRTLHHEMIHLYCHTNEIQDTSRSGHYHNKNFKKACEERGFYYDEPADKKIGWSYAKVKPETEKIFKSFKIKESVFGIARMSEGIAEKTKKKSNIIKWVCPCCGDIIRSSKPTIKAYCMNDIDSEGNEKDPCGVMFEAENQEEEGSDEN